MGLAEKFCQEDGSQRSVRTVPTIVQLDDDAVLDGNKSFMIEFLENVASGGETRRPTDCIGEGRIVKCYIYFNTCF